MDIRSTNVKKNINDTCDSILKHLESPPNKRQKLNPVSDFINKTSLDKLPENTISHKLYQVVSIKKEIDGELMILRLNCLNKTEKEDVWCNLMDSWANANIENNYLVHILTDSEQDGNYVLNDSKGYLIVNPHYILSGTNILSALNCLRRAVLSWKFKANDSNSSYMLLGTILHNLFQTAISKGSFLKADLKNLLIDLLKQKKIINQLYECNLDEDEVLKETEIYLSSIEKWIKENTTNGSSVRKDKNFHVNRIHDIEESIWSPKYGIKGNLDLTIDAQIKVSAFKQLMSKAKNENLNQTQSYTIPVELKSGRPTFSVEHEGQVMLYSLLNHEKRQQSDIGLLLYLKDMSMKFIKVNQTSLRGLIQLRNDLVHNIYSNKLPEFKNEERICSKCPLLTTCSLIGDKTITSSDNQIYSSSISHLNQSYKSFFFKWYEMLELENGDFKQFDAGDTLWWKSQDELEKTGYSIFDLKFDSVFKSSDNQLEGPQLYRFVKIKQNINQNLMIKENDMVLLSSIKQNQIGICQGFLKSANKNKTEFVLLFDNQLAKRISTVEIYRIDKINFRSSINLNYSNLSRLMNNNEKSSRLRSFIIDKKIPQFDKSLAKNVVLNNKSILKKLNQSQQASVLKALMAQDYLLIKGYPGTGKTTTIAALIAILVSLGKKVLFTSYTNSAVDNLLLKILEQYPIDFIRIGSIDRIHSDVRNYELNFLTSSINSSKELDNFLKEKKLVAATCSNMGNPLFNKLDFDYCIVDEASQVLFTTCLGPLFLSEKFILVGDLEQLPPIVKNKDARLLGMNVSLFEWLDSPEGSVELVHQYRMNEEIMNLANTITYNGKLQCLSASTATSFIEICPKFLSKIEPEKIRNVFTKSVIFIDTTNLVRKFNASNSSEGYELRLENRLESEIVKILVQTYLKFGDLDSEDDIGIIAPYNNQVKEIHEKLSDDPKCKNIEVNTVDQFQGRDKKLIIMSFTNSIIKSEENKEFEILNDKRRLTVGITRAKKKLILIGCIESLKRYKSIEILINYMNSINLVTVTDDINEFNF